MNTFSEKEKRCEALFESNVPFWHVCTKGPGAPVIFTNEEDFTFVMNVMAQASMMFPNVKTLTFEIMGNHVHFIQAGLLAEIKTFFEFVRKRISGEWKRRGKDPLPPEFEFSALPIDNLKYLRAAIAYVNRNGFTSNPSYTPFNYPWGANAWFFNCIPEEKNPYQSIPYRKKEKMFAGRAPAGTDKWNVIRGFISPSSYCALDFAQNIFRDGNDYFFNLSKNVEAMMEVGAAIGDYDAVSDSELFPIVMDIIRSAYGATSIRQLTIAQKQDVARILRKAHHSSNGQISRILYLNLRMVDEMFPLSQKDRNGH